jgi:uncharacterized protein involved in exopolysaccharide biosynthesis
MRSCQKCRDGARGAPGVWAEPMRAEMAMAPEASTLIAPRAMRGEAGQVETAAIGRILWRRRRGIALCGAGAFAAALAYCLAATPQYTATAEILVDPRDKQVVANDVNPSSIAADGGITQVESQGDVLLSDSVLRRAVAAQHLEEDPEFNGSGLFHALSSAVSSLLHKPSEADLKQATLSRTLLTLRKQAHYNRADKALVLDLSVRANTAQKAADIANAIANAYRDDQREARANSARDASKQLESRLNELQADVARKEAAVEDYRAQHNFVVSTGQLVSDQEINQATAQLSNAQNRVSSLKAQLDQLRRNAGTESTPEAMSSAVMGKLRDREGALVEKLASASRLLGPRHPDIAALEQSLAEVRGLIVKETQRLRQAVEADYTRAVADEKALAAKLDAMKSQSLDNGKLDVDLRELQRQADTAREIYQSFMLRAKETMEASNVDTSNTRLISPALPPLQKSWPPTVLLLLGASFLGLSLGASGALAREYLQPNLYTPGQLRDALDAPLLGVVTAAQLESDRPCALAGAALAALTRGETMTETGSPIGHCAFIASAPYAADARRLLAQRLAALAAREGFETLLIDADFAADAASERAGLRELLRGDQSVADLAYREKGEGFSRLAKGALETGGFRRREGADGFRLRRVRRHYDLVVIDAGAMSENARLAPLAAQADLTLLVAMTGEPLADVQGEADAASSAGARFDAAALVEAALG